MSEKSSTSAVALPNDQLKDLAAIISTAIQEARKPVISDREKAQVEDDQKRRKENAEAFKATKENEQRQQTICDHRTRLVTGADTGSAIVANKNGRGDVTFFICQHCRLVCRPEEEGLKGYIDGVLYDTAKFNQFFIEKINTGGV
jgi:hypothetical protein